MTWDEEENAVRELGKLIGYQKLIQIAQRLNARPPQPIDLSRGHCIHKTPLNRRCVECETEQTNARSVR